MTSKNLQNRVEMTPTPFDGATTMWSQTENPTQSPLSQNSISEAEYSIRLGWGARHMLNLRKAGKLPVHFLAPQPGRSKPQVRYLLANVEKFELEQQKNQTPKMKKPAN